jgi:hypothetical protein
VETERKALMTHQENREAEARRLLIMRRKSEADRVEIGWLDDKPIGPQILAAGWEERLELLLRRVEESSGSYRTWNDWENERIWFADNERRIMPIYAISRCKVCRRNPPLERHHIKPLINVEQFGNL